MKIRFIRNNPRLWKLFFLNMENIINKALVMDIQGHNLWNIWS